MDWTLILTVSAGIITATAAFLAFKNKKTLAICFTLVAAAMNCISAISQKKDYSSEVPAVTASSHGKFMQMIIVNVDKELPLKDVSVKMGGFSTLKLGTLYPQVVNWIGDWDIPKRDTTWIMVVWYNGTQIVEVDFNFKVSLDSSASVNSKYFDNKGVEFTPEWKIRAAKSIDTAIHRYNPTLFQ